MLNIYSWILRYCRRVGPRYDSQIKRLNTYVKGTFQMIFFPHPFQDEKMQNLKPNAQLQQKEVIPGILSSYLFCLIFCDTSALITVPLYATSKHSFLQIAYHSSKEDVFLFTKSKWMGWNSLMQQQVGCFTKSEFIIKGEIYSLSYIYISY